MKLSFTVAFLATILSWSPANAQKAIGEVDTTFRLLSPNDKVVVERYDDPRVANVSCYVSRAQTGGFKGAIGLAEDPSRFSIACRNSQPVTAPDNLPQSEIVFKESTSALFKTLRVTRMLDREKGMLVYVVTSTKLIDGSPFNSISAVPLTLPPSTAK